MIRHRAKRPFVITLLFLLCAAGHAEGVRKVGATRDAILVEGVADHPLEIAELDPAATDRPSKPVGSVKAGAFHLSVPRFDGQRDRIYSAFAASRGTTPDTPPRFVESMTGVDRLDEAYPVTTSKKGLQVADVADALALGIQHAALNLPLNTLIDLNGKAGSIKFITDGKPFYFRRGAVEGLDRRVKQLSDAGVVVSFILLYYRSGDAALDALMLHPHYDPACPGGISAFNVSTPAAAEELKACFEFLAERYSRPDRAHGRAVNFIVGNEVDSHWSWYNLGHADAATVADQYARAVRLCHTAVRKYNAAARVFISLEHCWNTRYPDGDAAQSCPGRELLERLHTLIATQGDFDWGVAYHPYPQDLFNPRFWLDKSVTWRDDTPLITFRNLEVLPRYLQRPDLRIAGEPRHVILSEQGFHTPKGAVGEKLQAAAFACAYYRVDHMPGIDAFILHRHFDSTAEGGLHLGLWWEPGTNPNGGGRQKKMIYDVFRAAGTEGWKAAFEFALPVVGIRSWSEVDPHEQR